MRLLFDYKYAHTITRSNACNLLKRFLILKPLNMASFKWLGMTVTSCNGPKTPPTTLLMGVCISSGSKYYWLRARMVDIIF